VRLGENGEPLLIIVVHQSAFAYDNWDKVLLHSQQYLHHLHLIRFCGELLNMGSYLIFLKMVQGQLRLIWVGHRRSSL